MLSTSPDARRLWFKAQRRYRSTNGSLPGTGVPDTHSAAKPGNSSYDYDLPKHEIGLTVLHEPENAPSVDIIFVHGLGGSSHHTWARKGKPDLFWPRKWLPAEEGLKNARISTFGYDADFMCKGPKKTWTISDFANILLFWLDSNRKAATLGFGKAPVIFIAHSMGGLVVKKACVLSISLGQNNVIARSTTGIIFLSTPHRGSDLADWLELILEIPFLGHSSKPYISELIPNSLTLQEINNQFWPLIPHLTLESFYETLPTPIHGLVKKVGNFSLCTTEAHSLQTILSKDSATIGYPHEVDRPLAADHHGVCKYASTHDGNYALVLDILKKIVIDFEVKHIRQQHLLKSQELDKLKMLLQISELPDKDHQDFYKYYMPDSCQRFISDPIFQTWVENRSESPHILWVNGPIGVGKSVLSSYLVQYLKELGRTCHFYYFRLEKQDKSLRGGFLRSLAYQVANDVPKFREQLSRFLESPDYEQTEDGSNIWRRLFTGMLFKEVLAKPIYWIVDSIDACDSPPSVVNLMAPLSAFGLPLRVMFLSRRSNQLSTLFQNLASSVQVTEFNLEADQDDLNRYVQEKISNIRSSPEFMDDKEEMGKRILRSARGNFLWTRLVLERLLQCRRRSEFEAALEELHPELVLYQQMDENLTRTLNNPDLELARMAFSWTICSKRQLTSQELSEALQSKEDPIYDLVFSIDEVCGGFVVVNSDTSQVTVIHHSAQEYLTTVKGSKLHIDLPVAHGLLFRKCMSILCKVASNFPNQDLSPASLFKQEPLLQYATFFWFYHLSEIGVAPTRELLKQLKEFLDGPYILVWISIVASCLQLQPIVEAAEALSSIQLQQQPEFGSENYDLLHRQDSASSPQRWSIDLLQITAQFGNHLVRYPRSIYSLIPAFCPPESTIHKFMDKKLPLGPPLTVTGICHSDWDDCLARFLVRKNCRVLQILCTDDYFAVSTTSMNAASADGCVTIYRTKTCEELRTLKHGEALLTMQFSASGHLLATSGSEHIKVWTMKTDSDAPALPACIMPTPDRSRLLALAFCVGDQSLIICSQDGSIRRRSLESIKTGWDDVGLAFSGIGTLHSKAPSCAAFNRDASLIVLGFLGAATTVWDLTSFRASQYHQRRDHSSTAVRRVEWNSKSHHVIGVYHDGSVFKWKPETDEALEFQANAIDLKCSLQGNLFATSSGDSKLTVWDFDQFLPVYELFLPARITGLAIDPDGRRIYELGESYCTIWQPISLMRQKQPLQSHSGKLRATSGIAQQAAMPKYTVTRLKDITALAIAQKTSAYCVGNMDGDIQVFYEDGKVLPIKPLFRATIEHVVWSSDEQYVAFANFGCQIRVEKLSAVDSKTVLHKTVDAPVQQLLFKKSSNVLLAITNLSLYIWDVENQSRFKRQSAMQRHYRWTNYPQNEEQLLGFAFDKISILRWEDLKQEFLLEIQPSISNNSGNVTSDDGFESSDQVSEASSSGVEKLCTSCDGSIIFLQVSQSFLLHNTHDEFYLWHAEGVLSSDCNETQQTSLVPLPQHLQAIIQVPLGFVKGQFNGAVRSFSTSDIDVTENNLVFLSNEGWVCTMYLGSADIPGRVKSHFFLPRDWLVKESLELAQISTCGTLFCPKNGEVGIIENGLGTEWAG